MLPVGHSAGNGNDMDADGFGSRGHILRALHSTCPLPSDALVVISAYLGLTPVDVFYDVMFTTTGLPRPLVDLVSTYDHAGGWWHALLADPAYPDAYDDLRHDCVSESLCRHGWRFPVLDRCSCTDNVISLVYHSSEHAHRREQARESDTHERYTFYFAVCVRRTPFMLQVSTDTITHRVQHLWLTWSQHERLSLVLWPDGTSRVSAMYRRTVMDRKCSLKVDLCTSDDSVPWKVAMEHMYTVPLTGLTLHTDTQRSGVLELTTGCLQTITTKGVRVTVLEDMGGSGAVSPVDIPLREPREYTLSLPLNEDVFSPEYKATYSSTDDVRYHYLPRWMSDTPALPTMNTKVVTGLCGLERSQALLDAADVRARLTRELLRSVRCVVGRMLAQAQYVLQHWVTSPS